jgi:CubicO group peptidase (beta-lactamase class C family)
MRAQENLEASGSSSKSSYTIPEELQPVWTWKDGYSATETKQFRQKYEPAAAATADDVGSYSSSRFSEIRNTAVVHRMGQVSILESEPIPAIGDVTAATILGTMTLEEMMGDPRSRMKAIAVIHDGKVAFEKYIGIRDWDNHLWASATKILSGTLMHMAEEEELVDLNNPVTTYLPDLKGTDWEGVKVEDVLHHCSGLDISESRLDSSPDHPVTLLYTIGSGDTSGSSLIDAVKVCKKRLEPGTRYEYASINTFVVTLILERVYDIPVEDLITDRIWGKSGMEGDGLLGLSARGEQMLFGAFAARLRDLARFGMLFTPSWKVIANEQVVSDEYFDKVQQAAKPEVYGEDYMSERLIHDFEESGFGASYQWDAVFADGDLYKSGRFGQCLYVSPETNTVIVWYSSAYQAEVWVHAYAREIVKQIFR